MVREFCQPLKVGKEAAWAFPFALAERTNTCHDQPMTEHWLICGPPIFTSVARWEAHLAWLHEHPKMVGYDGHVRRAQEHIAWLKGLGDPYPDHRTASKARSASSVIPEPDLEAMERELDRHRRERGDGDGKG